MSTPQRTRLIGAVRNLFAGLSLALVSGLAYGAYGLNLQPPASPIAEEILGLHNMIMVICLIIFVVVFGFMFYSIFAHRKSRGHKAASFHESTTIEIVWTTIPFLILVGMAIPSTATLLKMEDTKSQADIVIKITGYQWKWRYEYPDHDISFFSNLSTPREQIENKAEKGKNYLLEVDNPVVIPVGKKVRFLVTANDVIHAWWIPQLGVKKDAIPGFLNETWAIANKPGTYRGQCAELCGKDHGYMPIVVEAVEQEKFTQWVSAQKAQAQAAAADSGKQWTKEELLGRGEKVYTQCAACHGAKGEGVATFPKLTGSKIATGPVADHIKIVLKGKPGTAMQAYAGQMNDADIAAVVTYERNALGNKTGDAVQPAQVKALR
ncbi:MAG: cytochrome c oxidase subunit II [Candidatus Muproteobacteria bacterium RBG_16_64_11]|uniref:Cytochrome c oxidase subunit 2 n=1 Tax=Candidatus Muproteobacteria bacterium RBG_16_64_11 TaxID=1817758 RepID=A0A1F6TCN7_9PROT|nr:MAG: cytochrome c oxidase subunit II [Candidatus Muproteobacteria bacterium RBG_16_64_11]